MMGLFSKGVGHFLFGVIVILVVKGIPQATSAEEHHRFKREVDCEAKYKQITTAHSACKQPSDSVTESGVSDEDKKIILDMHNTARKSVSPSATNMMLMTWDDEIANTAQRWAENCVQNHDDNYKRYAFGRFSVGQNLAMGYSDWTKAITGWELEKVDYDYTTNASPTNKVVGHYTQMVWAKSSKIGCGFAKCDSTNFYVCNYGPGGNSGRDKPYESGETCSACRSRCNNGLCDCNGVVCLNGGTIDYNTCTCNCVSNYPFYLSPTCGLNCTGNRESPFCNQYGESGCTRFTNVPQECPVMCKWCPTAAFNQEDTTDRVTDSQTETTPDTTHRVTDSPPETTTAKANSVGASVFICFVTVFVYLFGL